MFPRVAFLILALCLSANDAFAEKRVALLIGNQDYPATVGKLYQPHADVDVVSTALNDTGFETVVLKDADKTTMEKEISQFIARINDDEVIAFFYFSGHGGSQEVVGRRRNYLVPARADVTTSAQLPFSAVALDNIIDGIAATKAKSAFIVSDACRNTLRMAGDDKGGAPQDRSFSAVQRRAGLYIANATADGETAPDDGLFARALAEQIRTPGLYAPRAFSLAFREVSKSRQGYRLPTASDALNEDFCFNGCEKASAESSGGVSLSGFFAKYAHISASFDAVQTDNHCRQDAVVYFEGGSSNFSSAAASIFPMIYRHLEGCIVTGALLDVEYHPSKDDDDLSQLLLAESRLTAAREALANAGIQRDKIYTVLSDANFVDDESVPLARTVEITVKGQFRAVVKDCLDKGGEWPECRVLARQ